MTVPTASLHGTPRGRTGQGFLPWVMLASRQFKDMAWTPIRIKVSGRGCEIDSSRSSRRGGEGTSVRLQMLLVFGLFEAGVLLSDLL